MRSSKLPETLPWLIVALVFALPLPACQDSSPQRATLPGGEATARDPQTSSVAPADDSSASRHAEIKKQRTLEHSRAPSSQVPPLASLPQHGWPTAERVAAANLDGEGRDELLCWNQGKLAIWAQGDEAPYEIQYSADPDEPQPLGAPNQVWTGDLDGDGREDVLMAYGMTRTQTSPPITLVVLRVKGEPGAHRKEVTVLYKTTSPRPQVTGLEVADVTGDGRLEILLSHYDSKYFVVSHRLSLKPTGDPLPGLLTRHPLQRIRMATSWTVGPVGRRGQNRVVVGRPYGDRKLDLGDLAILEGDRRRVIPTWQGVRSVAVGDADGDGKTDILFGDGWHFEYGKRARGRLSIARQTPDGWRSTLIEDTPGQYEVQQISVRDLDGDGRPEVIAAGNRYTSLYWFQKEGWYQRRLGNVTAFTLAHLKGGLTLVAAGSPIRLFPLQHPRAGGTLLASEAFVPIEEGLEEVPTGHPKK